MRVMPWAVLGSAVLLAACTQTATKTPPLTPEARGPLERMAGEATQVLALFKASPRRYAADQTPEFLQLQMDWDERLFDCRVSLQPNERATLAAEWQASAAAHLSDVQSHAMPNVSAAEVAMAQYAVAEAQSHGSPAQQKSALVDMASHAAHAVLELGAVNHAQTMAWRTLEGKWLWRAASTALETALPGMDRVAIVDEWIRDARSASEGGSFVEQFSLARLESLRAALRKDDKAVMAAGNTMIAAAQAGPRDMENGDRIALTPEAASDEIDWSRKLMEADGLVHKDVAAKRAALETHAARVLRMDQKTALAPRDEVITHMLNYAEAEADYLRTTLK